MGIRWLWPVAIVTLVVMGRAARADGVCVSIDTSRDNLTDGERAAVRVAIIAALESEGVATARVPEERPPSSSADLGRSRYRALHRDGQRLQYSARQHDLDDDRERRRTVSGKASSIDELDLLVRQLVRSLVTGRAFATGTGVQDRQNVLRDQQMPRRADPSTFE